MGFNLLGLLSAGAGMGQGFNQGNQQALQAQFQAERLKQQQEYNQGRVQNGAAANAVRLRGQDLTNNKNAASEYDKIITTHPEMDPTQAGDLIDARFGTNIGHVVRGMAGQQQQQAPAAGQFYERPADGTTVLDPATPTGGAAPPTVAGMFGRTDRNIIAAGRDATSAANNQRTNDTRFQVADQNDQTKRDISSDSLGVRLKLGSQQNQIGQQRADTYQQATDQAPAIAAGHDATSRAVGAGHDATTRAVGAGHDSTSRFNTTQTNNTRITTTGMNNDTAVKVGAGHDAASRYHTDATTAIQDKIQSYKQYTNDPYLKDIQARLGFATNEIKRGQGIVNFADNQKDGALKSGTIDPSMAANIADHQGVNINQGNDIVNRNLKEAQRLQAAADAYIAKKYGSGSGPGRFTAPAPVKKMTTEQLIELYRSRNLGSR